MIHAIENLNALSNEGEHENINNLVTKINQQLKEINNLLGIQEGIQSNVSEDDLEDDLNFFDAQTGPNSQQRVRGPMVDVNDVIMFNGAQKSIGEIMDFLKGKNNQIKRNDPNNKYKIALDFIMKSPNSQEIQNYLQQDTYKGGRKTRKNKRKTRKTRKIKKQKGGYYYNPNTKRKSITSSSKRISKRTRRTTSSF
jgi:hypothetical protein